VDAQDTWNEVVKQVERRINSIYMADLPLHIKTGIINVHAYTKVVYLDQFLPAPKSVIDRLQKIGLNALWHNPSRPAVSGERATRLTSQGGLGLWRLADKLTGGRAKWVYRLLHTDSENYRLPGLKHALFLRAKQFGLHLNLSSTGNVIPIRECDMMRSYGQWFDACFKQDWKDRIVSWNALTAAGSCFRDLVTYLIYGQSQTLRLRDINDKPITTESFRGTQATIMQGLGPLIPPRLPEDTATQPIPWERRWKDITKIRLHDLWVAETSHLLSLGCLKAPIHLGKYAPNTLCCLCEEEDESLEHIFTNCYYAKRAWALLSGIIYLPKDLPYSLSTLRLPPNNLHFDAKMALAIMTRELWIQSRKVRFSLPSGERTSLKVFEDQLVHSLNKGIYKHAFSHIRR